MSKALLRSEAHGEIGTAPSLRGDRPRGSRGDRLATKPTKPSACFSPYGLRAKVSARLSPYGLGAKVSARLSFDSLWAKPLSQQK